MAEKLYEERDAGGADHRHAQWSDPTEWRKDDMEAEVADIEELQALSDSARTRVAQLTLTTRTLAEFDTYLEDRWGQLKDLIHYFDYTKKERSLWVADELWFPPESVESVCGEEVGQGAALMLDSDNATYWEHNVNETHVVVLKIRDWPKRIEGIRIRCYNGVLKNFLRNCTIKCSKALSEIDNPGNVMMTGVDFATGGVWNEAIFPTAKSNGRYLKLEVPSTDNTQNYIIIRSLEVRAGVRLFDVTE